jgi:hypothetical protein
MRPLTLNAKRYCMSCREYRPRDGGAEVLSHGGKRYRWICQRCKGAKHAASRTHKP